ncbi:MAG: RHS repeat-associated core domain-containing protein [Anaerolineae bacterium]|nr:RHS repeat-associated core domain-containing protein [Anaerolineae bacterium]
MRINGTLCYVLKDHLGSASVVTDTTGAVVGEQRYYPFGETRLTTGTLYTDKLFTGQREMAGLGIYHYQSRFYSPKLGRFLSADSLVPNPYNPQDFNRFSYVRNNPVRYVDPSGHRVPLPCELRGNCSDYGDRPPPPPCRNCDCGGGGGDRGGGGADTCTSVVCVPTPTPQPELPPAVVPQVEDSQPSETIGPLIPEYDFIAPWELNRLDALGIRLNGTYCFILICGDISVDIIGNSQSNEATLFVTPGLGAGLGWGFDFSGGIVAAYDAPNNNSLAGLGRNLTINYTPGVGFQASRGIAVDPNVTGNYAQTYSLGITGGEEASLYYSASYSFPIGTCDMNDCYFGVK